ncbi:uncharacterized protein LOC134699106 [Mytilus trossulus]|uniref:uncharacterized protein LOC134699106 n=1 Tax=Mytilus trossulus TaxID=6551 RepID=UPI003006CBE7
MDGYMEMIPVILLYITLECIKASTMCSQVITLDCDTQYAANEAEEVCGTNGISYHNFCYYAQAKCNYTGLDIHNVGPCLDDTKTTAADLSGSPTINISNHQSTTKNPVTTTKAPAADQDPIQHLFCTGVSAGTIACPDELDPYCGTDGIFYLNNCCFAKAKCLEDSLSKQPLDQCKGKIPSGRK